MSLLDRIRARFFLHAQLSPLSLLAHINVGRHFYVVHFHANRRRPHDGHWRQCLLIYRSPNATPWAATRWYCGRQNYHVA